MISQHDPHLLIDYIAIARWLKHLRLASNIDHLGRAQVYAWRHGIDSVPVRCQVKTIHLDFSWTCA